MKNLKMMKNEKNVNFLFQEKILMKQNIRKYKKAEFQPQFMLLV